MNISGVIGVIFIISIIFLAGTLIIDDLETNYVDTNISSADEVNQSLKDQFINQSELNETFAPIQEKVEDLQSQEGFLDVLGDGSIVLPTLFISFVGTILSFIGLSNTQIFSILKFIQIPVIIITFIGIGIVVWFIFKIIDQIRRYPA